MALLVTLVALLVSLVVVFMALALLLVLPASTSRTLAIDLFFLLGKLVDLLSSPNFSKKPNRSYDGHSLAM